MRILLGLLGLLLFYIALTLAVMEAGVRLLRLAPPAESPGYFWRVPDPITGWTFEPGAQGRWFNAMYEYDLDVSINELGLRSPASIRYEKPADAFRVIVLGDSFVEGIQVTLEETFPQQLSQHLQQLASKPGVEPRRIEVISAGAGGWGNDQQLLWLRHEGVKYQPDLVIVAFYPANDFHNNHMPLEFANVGAVRKPWFSLENGELTLHNFPFDPNEARETARLLRRQLAVGASGSPAAAGSAPLRVLDPLGDWLYRHSTLMRYIDPRVRISWSGLAIRLGRWGLLEPGKETAEAAMGPDYIPIAFGAYRQPPTAEWETAFLVTGEIFRSIQTEAAAMGARAAGVVLTAAEQVDENSWRQILTDYPAMQHHAWSLEQPSAKAMELFTAAGMPALDLGPVFRQGVAQGAILHLQHDGHWTPAGHALAGAALADFVLHEGLTPFPAPAGVAVIVPAGAWSLWHWIGWVVLTLLGVSLAWSLYQTGPLAWLRHLGVRLGTAGELVGQVIHHRQYLLLPLVIILLLFGGLLMIAQASVVGPFIYTLF